MSELIPLDDPDWVDKVHARLLAAVLDDAREVPEQGSLWVSVNSGRRGSVVWVSGGKVCLSFNENDVNARKTHGLEDFKRLYTRV